MSFSRENLDLEYISILLEQAGDERAHLLSLLGSAYYALYDESRRRRDLEKAISVHEEAVRLTSTTHPRLAEHLGSFALTLQERFDQLGDTRDIERAIELYENA